MLIFSNKFVSLIFTGEKILLDSTTALDNFPDSVFTEKLVDDNEQFSTSTLIEEASGSTSPSTTFTDTTDISLDEFDLDPIDFDALLEVNTEENENNEINSEAGDSDVSALLDFDDTDLDMYIQSSSYANAHSRQQIQNYGHGQLRQSGYLPHHPQVSFFFFLLLFFIFT